MLTVLHIVQAISMDNEYCLHVFGWALMTHCLQAINMGGTT